MHQVSEDHMELRLLPGHEVQVLLVCSVSNDQDRAEAFQENSEADHAIRQGIGGGVDPGGEVLSQERLEMGSFDR